MKKTFLLLVANCLCFVAIAQISQGTVSLGGTLNISANTSKSEENSTSHVLNKSNSFNFSPRIGYFIADGLSIGAVLTVSSSSQTNYSGANNEVIYKSLGFGIGPFARYYKSIGENFYVFGEGMLSIGTSGNKVINGNTTTKNPNSGVFGVSVSPGIAFFPAPKFGIELSFVGISFKSSTSKSSNGNTKHTNSSFSFGPNTFSPTIGVQYYF